MSNACGAQSPDGRWRCSFLPPHGPRHSWDSVRPAVLLRDTPEDRERLIAALARWWEAEAPDHGQNDAEADAIIAALRGEG